MGFKLIFESYNIVILYLSMHNVLEKGYGCRGIFRLLSSDFRAKVINHVFIKMVLIFGLHDFTILNLVS
jgi:hypothetical protein